MVDKIILDRIVEEFREPRDELNGESYEERRDNKFADRFQGLPHLFSEEHLPKLTMDEAEELYIGLRTGSKSSRTRQLHNFRKNSLESIRTSLEYLLYGDEPLHVRFSELVDSDGEYKLSGGAEDFVSTVLHVYNPQKYAVWNTSAIDGLEELGFHAMIDYEDTVGKKYQRINEILGSISKEYDFDDLSVVDELLRCLHKGDIVTSEVKAELDKADRSPPDYMQKKVRPPTKESPPETRTVERTEVVRDPKVVRNVKEAEAGVCQVCGIPINLLDGSRYSEAHHIQPLSEDGNDEECNVLCLCPNHHVEMEYGLFYIDPISKKIVHHDADNPIHGRTLLQNQNPDAEIYHELDYDSLVLHRDRFCKWTGND
jgi:predicted restriction endonuclease